MGLETKSTKAIVTVLGKDQVGIIAGVTQVLAECGVNILDISQTIMKDFFTMIMVTDLVACQIDLASVSQKLRERGDSLGVEVRIQHEDAFNFMHRI